MVLWWPIPSYTLCKHSLSYFSNNLLKDFAPNYQYPICFLEIAFHMNLKWLLLGVWWVGGEETLQEVEISPRQGLEFPWDVHQNLGLH
jgi:hypothetical protein